MVSQEADDRIQAAAKADHVVEKAETKEHKAMKSMHKAAHTHDVATSELHQAQNDLEVSFDHSVVLSTEAYHSIGADKELFQNSPCG